MGIRFARSPLLTLAAVSVFSVRARLPCRGDGQRADWLVPTLATTQRSSFGPSGRGAARLLRAACCVAALVLALCVVLPAAAQAVPPQHSLGTGAWCWFADPRGVHYEGAHRRTYIGWVADDGDIKVSAFDHDSGIPTTVVLHSKLQVDDHTNPALLVCAGWAS